MTKFLISSIEQNKKIYNLKIIFHKCDVEDFIDFIFDDYITYNCGSFSNIFDVANEDNNILNSFEITFENINDYKLFFNYLVNSL